MTATLIPATLSPTPVLVTAAEFTARYAGMHAELIKGVVKEYPGPMPQHGYICSTINGLLWQHVRSNDLGRVMCNDSWIRTGTSPDSVRGADVCYFSYERLPRGPVPPGLLTVVPELVIEVRSPSDRWNDVFIKAGEYLNAGVRVVIVLDPRTESASVYRSEELQQIFHNGDDLVIPELLPGFAVPVRRLFE